MKGSMKVHGYQAVRQQFRSIGKKVPDAARKQMHRAAERTVERARLYVPEDEQHLRNSIRIEKSYGVRGRLQIDIVVGDMTAVKANGRVIDLNQYAAIIHENYAAMQPGKRTLEKRAANPGVHIGEKFLERAAEDENEKLQALMVASINAIIERESLL